MPIEKRRTKDGITYRARLRHRGRRGTSASFPTLAQARAWEAKYAGELHDARAGILPRRTLREAVAEYIARECPKHRGAKWEKARLAKFLRTTGLADRQLAAIAPDDIAKWRDTLARMLAPYSVQREYGLMRALFVAAVRWGWLRASPFAAVVPPGRGTPRSQRVTDEHAAAIVAALGWAGAAPTSAGEYAAAAFLLALETALRQGELLGAVREDYDAQRRILHVPRSKNGDAREVPLSKAAFALLALLPTDGRLFPIAAPTCDRLFRRARRAAGLDHIHFHDSRREATTRLAKKVDVLTLARITGHRDVNLLLRVYYRPDIASVVDLLD